MPFRPVQTERLAQSVVQQIELLILRGLLLPGERLPPERELAERLGVSRPSLREAIAELQGRGLLVARPGAGIFVAEMLGSAFSEALVKLFAGHDEALFDYIDFRRDLEGMAAERELSERLGVSRPSLREAIAELQERGLLATRAGAGIYVAEVLGASFSPALVELFRHHDEALFDYVAFRRDMEGLAAERAARFGSDTDLQVVDAIFAKMEAANARRNPADDARLDADFHLAIVEASHNVIMLHMMRSMYELLRQGVFYNRQAIFRQKTTREALLDQHRAINAALQARDPAGSRAAVESHLDFVRKALEDGRRAERNEAVARRRLEHEHER